MQSTLLTAQEVADMLKITKNTVYELVKRGEIGSCKVGKKIRIDLADVQAFTGQTRTVAQKTHSNPVDFGQIESKNLADDSCISGMIVSGQDIALDMIVDRLNQRFEGLNACRSAMGSYNSIYALYQGKVNIATSHLWDSELDEYNVSYVTKMMPGIPVLIIRMVRRNQGFYIKEGNPQNITGWQDLLREDIILANREKGSGTRVLLDEKLRQMGVYGSSIKGYNKEFYSHLAVASAVVKNEANVGLGSEKGVQQVSGLEFIKLQTESYDLIMRMEDAQKPQYKAVLEIMASGGYKRDLQSIGCYDTSETGKLIYKSKFNIF